MAVSKSKVTGASLGGDESGMANHSTGPYEDYLPIFRLLIQQCLSKVGASTRAINSKHMKE
jgi:hypothetical protein